MLKKLPTESVKIRGEEMNSALRRE